MLFRSFREWDDPIRVQYREAFVVVRCRWNGQIWSRCVYIWVDKDFAVGRGILQGYPKKLGSIQMNRPVTVGKAGPRLELGGRLAATVSAYDRRLANARVTLTGTSDHAGFVNGHAMLHQMQGAYHVKGFSKHGPLHNAHAYGYFEHVPYRSFQGGHVTCGGVLYQGGAFGPERENQYIAGNLLSSVVNWHKMEPVGATFKAAHAGTAMDAKDSWFRPIDLLVGPDAGVYVVDWYDKRATHLDPLDTWDRSNGRIYRLHTKGSPPIGAFNLDTKTSEELVSLLSNPNAWWRREARRILAERKAIGVLPSLDKLLGGQDQALALEALWAAHEIGRAHV